MNVKSDVDTVFRRGVGRQPHLALAKSEKIPEDQQKEVSANRKTRATSSKENRNKQSGSSYGRRHLRSASRIGNSTFQNWNSNAKLSRSNLNPKLQRSQENKQGETQFSLVPSTQEYSSIVEIVLDKKPDSSLHVKTRTKSADLTFHPVQ
jgi:hypothetical protein